MYINFNRMIFIFIFIGLIFAQNSFGLGMTDEEYFTQDINIQYLSPQNKDGIQDNIKITLPERLVPEEGIKITALVFKVYDFNGKIYFNYSKQYDSNVEYFYNGESNDRKGLGNGVYLYSIIAYYNDDSKKVSNPYPLIVDNTTPEGFFVSLNMSIEDFVQSYANKNISAYFQIKNLNTKDSSTITQKEISKSKGNAYNIDADHLPKIYFAAYSDNIFSVTKEKMLQENIQHIKNLASFLTQNTEYKITLEGHAVAMLSGEEGKIEQEKILIPLSRRRAESIKNTLILLGVDKSRITIVATGNRNSVSKKGNADYFAKNRRVEFKLSK